VGDYYPRGLLAHALHAHAVHTQVDNLNAMHANVTHAHAVHVHANCHRTAKPVSISMPNKLLNVKYCGKKKVGMSLKSVVGEVTVTSLPRFVSRYLF
jgi:hypothetical protein